MAATRDFKEMVQNRIADDSALGEALLREGLDILLTDDVDTGNLPKRLICKLGPLGGPQARDLSGFIGYLQKRALYGNYVIRFPTTSTDANRLSGTSRR
jgi:hypothetical protein